MVNQMVYSNFTCVLSKFELIIFRAFTQGRLLELRQNAKRLFLFHGMPSDNLSNIMDDKVRFQSWVFDFIVSRNFAPNVVGHGSFVILHV